MTVKLTRPQADTLRAIKNGMNKVPPLRRDVVDAMVRAGYLREEKLPGLRQSTVEITEAGKAFLR